VAIEALRLRPPAVAGGPAEVEVACQCGSEEEEATGEETSPVDGMANSCKSGIGQGVEMAAGIRMGAGQVNPVYIYLSMYTNLCTYYPCLPLTPYLYIYMYIYSYLYILMLHTGIGVYTNAYEPILLQRERTPQRCLMALM